ncbi:hypothetical protein KP509_17G026900 [Ceratopteris richardii]|uniref:t-SNARE coiled-coil homology domain-containing protein n=1 Tax=Ceratopteris richardii TaxID=49495 RepID=A0A8T2SSY0_CERRI|nr:hypothetical protein KP509_17G026900 [Ceratopteris richardii]
MNDLLPKSLKGGEGMEYVNLKKDTARVGDVEMGIPLENEQQSLAMFFEEVSAIKKEMDKVKELLGMLQAAHEESKTVHRAERMKEVRERMEREVREVLVKARTIKAQLDQLDASNAAARRLSGCGPGTSSDRTRISLTTSLRTKLSHLMQDFQRLRDQARSEYRDAVRRRFYTVNGQMPDEETVERIIDTGESEVFLQKAIHEQGRGQVLDTILEIQERHGAALEMERNLLELHQVFLDMAVLVDSQAEQLNDIEHYVSQANVYMDRGAQQLKRAKDYQRSTRKWMIIAIIILLVLVLLIVVPIATTFKRS